MNRGGRQSGFSLMEVMFAVLVLTMGMVFVACQFPVGMMNSRKIAETTLSGIDAHNSQAMVGLQLEGIIKELGFPSYAMEHRDSNVHLLVKPNVPANCGPGSWQLVLDDLEPYPYALPLYPNYGSYIIDPVPAGLGTSPRWLFWSQRDNPATPLPVNEYSSITTYFIGDIGNMMCPPVDISDRGVQKYLQRFTNPGVEELNAAIFDTAMKRNSSWCALYRCMEPTDLLNHHLSRKYCFYIFTLRTENKSLRYALQNNVVTGEVMPLLPATNDRVFPVPWRIDLNRVNVNIGNAERNYIGVGTKNNPILPAPRIFELDPYYANILQAGSIIVDADPTIVTIPIDWVDNGYVYEVEEVVQTEVSGYFLKLRRELEDNLNFIWVFPPAFDRNTETFVGPGPVVNVEQMVVTF